MSYMKPAKAHVSMHNSCSITEVFTVPQYKMGLDTRKPVFRVCGQVIPKPACSATETS